jgi:hypothetical protein
VKHFKFLFTSFSARVSRSAGITTQAVTFRFSQHGALVTKRTCVSCLTVYSTGSITETETDDLLLINILGNLPPDVYHYHNPSAYSYRSAKAYVGCNRLKWCKTRGSDLDGTRHRLLATALDEAADREAADSRPKQQTAAQSSGPRRQRQEDPYTPETNSRSEYLSGSYIPCVRVTAYIYFLFSSLFRLIAAMADYI